MILKIINKKIYNNKKYFNNKTKNSVKLIQIQKFKNNILKIKKNKMKNIY